MLYFLVDRSTGWNVVFLGRQVDRLECCILWSTGLKFVFLGRQVDRFECCILWSAGRQVLNVVFLGRQVKIGLCVSSAHQTINVVRNTTRHLYRQSNRLYLCVYRPWENNLTGRLHGAFSSTELTGLNFFVIIRTISTPGLKMLYLIGP